MRRIKLAGLVAVFTVLLGGMSLLAPVEASALMDCSEDQIEYVRGAIQDECGDWGGTAYVTCDGYSIQFHSIECNVS